MLVLNINCKFQLPKLIAKESVMTEKEMTREELIAMRNRDVSLSYEQSQSVLRMIKKVRDEENQTEDDNSAQPKEN